MKFAGTFLREVVGGYQVAVAFVEFTRVVSWDWALVRWYGLDGWEDVWLRTDWNVSNVFTRLAQWL